MMSNPNQHIIDELNRFRLSSETFYAVQIDAPWGSGKTHFIKQYIDQHCPRDSEDSPKNLLISLFGAKSAHEIEQQIASQLFSGGERLAGSLFSTLATGVGGFFKVDKAVTGAMEDSRAKVLSDRLKEVKNGIVVFDDVERCSMKLVDALGYINKFIEKEGFKVIIISNEQALTRAGSSKEEQENASLLSGFREKLVGRRMKLNADPESAYGSFIKDCKSLKAKKILEKEKAFSLIVFRASNRENLRSLRIAIEAFDRLIEGLDPAIPTKDEGLKDILGGCMYIACELGAAVERELVVHPTAGRALRLMRGIGGTSSEEQSADDKTLQGLAERYADVLNLQHPTVPFDVLASFVANGHLRKPELERSIRMSPLMAEPSAVPLWRRLIEVWNFNSEKLNNDTQELIYKLSRFEILDPGELIHLAGIMLWRESLGDVSITNGIDPEQYISQYLKDLASQGKYVDVNFHVFAIDRLSAYGYVVLWADENRAKLLRIHALIQSAMEVAASQKYPEIYAAICRALIEPTRDTDNLLNKDLASYLRMPVLKGASAVEFADIIMRDNEFDVTILKWLDSRYNHHVDPAVRAEEQPWIDELYNELRCRISRLPPPLDKWWLAILDKKLKTYITPSSQVSVIASQTDPNSTGDTSN